MTWKQIFFIPWHDMFTEWDLWAVTSCLFEDRDLTAGLWWELNHNWYLATVVSTSAVSTVYTDNVYTESLSIGFLLVNRILIGRSSWVWDFLGRCSGKILYFTRWVRYFTLPVCFYCKIQRLWENWKHLWVWMWVSQAGLFNQSTKSVCYTFIKITAFWHV